MAKTKSVSIELSRVLSEFSEEENERIRECLRKSALECRKDLKNTSPKRSGDFAKGWRIKKVENSREISYTIYNGTHPGLTHLLENGHLVKNQYGAPKRANATTRTTPNHFIKDAEERAKDDLIDRLTKEL